MLCQFDQIKFFWSFFDIMIPIDTSLHFFFRDPSKTEIAKKSILYHGPESFRFIWFIVPNVFQA